MSVLKNNRGTSELEFYHTAIKLRKEITQNLLRDFGVKNRDAVRSKNFPDDELRVKIVQEYPKMELFFNKYTRMQEEIRTRDVVSEYPYWLVFRFRDEMNLLRNINNTVKALESGENVSQGFIVFWLCERGKLRLIKSVHIWERVIQRSLCTNALVPVLQTGLIYDNGASMEGKGIHFALNRLDAHLHRFYRRNGFSNDGYILVIDFSKYFDNILHEPVYQDLQKNFTDERIINLAAQLIRPFCADRKDGKEISLGIGSQISQILAVRFPNGIDHFIEQELDVHEHGRYMDDSYLIHESKEYLQYCLEALKEKFAEKGIIVNTKKTQIIKLSSWFTFLKFRYKLTETGRVVVKPCKDSVTRERRKLHKLKPKFDNGELNFGDLRTQYASWRGYIEYADSYRTICNMDNIFNQLYVPAGEWR